MPSANFLLAPYCYLSDNGNDGFDLSIVVPHSTGFIISFPETPDDSDYSTTQVLKIPYTITEDRNATALYSSKVYTDVFALAPAAKKTVKVMGTFDAITYVTIQENDDATDTLAMTGSVAKNCPHIFLAHFTQTNTDHPKGLIPFDNMDFGTVPETIVTTGDDVVDTISLVTSTTSGVVIKMLSSLNALSINAASGNPGIVEIKGTPPPKTKTKRKNYSTH